MARVRSVESVRIERAMDEAPPGSFLMIHYVVLDASHGIVFRKLENAYADRQWVYHTKSRNSVRPIDARSVANWYHNVQAWVIM